MGYSRHSKHPVTGEYLTAVEYNELAEKHGWEKMPDWEAQLRDRLERTLTSGMYQIGGPGMIAWTGKGGKIEYEVELRRYVKDMASLPVTEVKKVPYKKMTYKELSKAIKEIFYPKK